MNRLASIVPLLALACARPTAPNPDGLGPPPPARASRIVSLAPSLTDVVIALGAAETIAGVTRYDEAEAVAKRPRVGGYSDPSVETILQLHPDLLLCQPSPGNKGAVERLAQAGLPVQVFKLESLDDVRSAITRVGKLVGRDADAQALVRSIDAARERARSAAQRRGRPVRTAILFDVDPIVAAGPGSFVHELLVDAGGEDVIAPAPQPFPRVPVETLLAQAPALVLLAPMSTRPGSLERLPEPLRGRVRELHEVGIARPGPGVIAALDELTRALDAAAGAGP